ncbi:helix-turn-helix domain-containing protein [Rothia sp. P4278]|uniref:helix-turn-helix domain-containing protein n=1 Tax=Rothia sp. P4278 TaxID=3402658 RepID=UPI003ADB7166
MSTTIEKIVAPAIENTDLLEELPLEEAKTLTARLRDSLHDTSQLYINAWKHQVWKTLGYTSWDGYITGEFGDLRVALPKEERSQTVIQMAKAGMPTRAIATSTGISKTTVNREIQKAQEENKLPDELEITGEDGKVRTSKKKYAPVLDESLLDMPAESMGIGYFSSTKEDKPQVKVSPPTSQARLDYGLTAVEDLATELEEAIKASMLANNRQRFDSDVVTLHLVTATSRALLATAGLINLFNLQPDLTGENEEIIKVLDSSVLTIDTVLSGLRGDDE